MVESFRDDLLSYLCQIEDSIRLHEVNVKALRNERERVWRELSSLKELSVVINGEKYTQEEMNYGITKDDQYLDHESA